MNALVQHHRRSFAALLFFICLHATAWGQLKANFTATPLTGCSPLLVYFTDQSSGNPAQWKWDLGNGVVSFLKNPSATYFNPGTYTVKLVVSNAAGKDSVVKSQFITVYNNPSVAFRFDKATGCFPLTVNFTDKSTAGSGSITAWQWDFGDGTVSAQQNPVHTYTSAGTFNLTLRVTNSNGCVKTYTQPQAITVANGVKAAFSFTDPGICPAPTSVQFTNASTGPGTLQFQWNFGDGAGSKEINPSHTYNSNGSYTVSLIATSAQGCADTITKKDVFKIGTAKAGFTYPASACVNSPVTFTNTSAPTPTNVKWEFGDGSFSTALKPVKSYSKEGSYTVRLINNYGACPDTVTKQLTVLAKPVADFTAKQPPACRLPLKVQFTPLRLENGSTYTWDFGDHTTANSSNPVHTYTEEGNYTVQLIVTNAGGCSDTVVKTNFIRIQTPHLAITGLPKNGCVPVSIAPTATVSPAHSVSHYRWNFGDGSTSTASNPSHSYVKAGDYDVSLVATTAEGCTDTVKMIRAVRAGEKPHAGFANTPTYVCPFEKVFFADKSTGNVDQWFWEFSDGGTSTEQNPVHQFSDTGWQYVRLIAFSNTCPDTVLLKNVVHVNPPIASFAVEQNCTDKFTKSFVDKSLGPQTWFWEFGDGTTSTEQNPVHVYRSTGTYSVRLTVTNENCTHSTVKTVMVIDEKADFTASDTVLCRNSVAGFTSSLINSNYIADWNWNFGDGTGSQNAGTAKHTYAKAGTYTVSLTIKDLLGCTSTKTTQVTIFGPTASFQSLTAASCLKENNIRFADASASDGQHPISKRIWNFGDSVIDSTASEPYQHRYTKAGTYTVSLTVVDDFGCRDNATQAAVVIIAQPVANFKAADTLTCTGKAVSFTNASVAVEPSYAWSFGDGGTSGSTNPSHAYSRTGTYAVKLLVTDKYGCKDSVTKTDLVRITYPEASFTLSDSVGTCPPLLVNFTNTSKDYASIAWDFGDGSSSTLDTPSHFYATPGTFYARLIAIGPGGCTDTLQKKIVVKGPSGTLSYGPLTGCEPLSVNFTASTQNSTSVVWDFSDGSTLHSKINATEHTYTIAGDFVPKLILTDAAGCSVPVVGTDTIHVKGISAAFTMNAAAFCNEGTVQFDNQTVSNDYITGYQWNFGDGGTSTDVHPKHRYATPGTYSVQLVVTTQSGCREEKRLTDTVRIYANPVVEISGDTTACAPATLGFTGVVKSGDASRLKWNWSFGNGNTSTQQNPAPQSFSTDGRYLIKTTATDDYGCSATAQKTLAVYPIPKTSAGADQWICRGSFQQLKVTGAERYQWKATPSLSCTDCDSPLAAPTDSTQYIVTGFNGFGCIKTDTVTIRVHQPFTLKVEKGDTICAGATIRLAASGADQYTWMPSLSIKNPATGITTATPQASTLYRVVAKDNVNCFTDTGSVYVKVWPIPTVSVESVQTLTVGSALMLTPKYSADITAYLWSNAQSLSCATCPTPMAKPKAETTYTITVKNDGGCTAKADVTVHVICNNGNLFIPNTFSPNADGHNDRFYPKGSGIGKIKSLTIYNRWGEIVFSRSNFDANDEAAGWDGTYKGQVLSPDVYIYTCEVVCMNNEVLRYKGDVTLLR